MTDMLDLVCPSCMHRFPLLPEYAGRTVFCPHCGASSRVEALPPGYMPAPPPVPMQPVTLTYAHSPVGVAYAGFWIRVADSIIDGLVLFLPSLVAAALIPGLGELLLWFLYESLLIAKWNGQTIGRKVCGFRVISSDGRPCGTGQACARTVAQFLSLLIFCIGYLMVAFDGRKRALHDHIAGTVCVYA